jgi:Alpha/beta hydrolase domain
MIYPMVTFSGPVTTGSIIEPASVVRVDLAASGYREDEYLMSGGAVGYDLVGAADADGRWRVEAGETAAFVTRILVRGPADPARFSGTLLVEWLNVSSGFDADPDWTFLHPEILRAGHAYVGVSAQAVGVMGGASRINPAGPAGQGLRAADPARYGTLRHPGDRYSFDLLRRLGEGLASTAGQRAVLGGLRPVRLIAMGESQAAFYLTSYVNAIQPLAPIFDGFLLHSRGAGAASLTGADIARETPGPGIMIRTDGQAPVLMLEAEGDVLAPLAYFRARQQDTDRIRLWEMAGTSHADNYLLGGAASLLGCDWRINEGPHRYVAQAALRALVRWVADGTPPPMAARIELVTGRPVVASRDSAGNALGGVRTPMVDVPVATLSGQGPAGKSLGWLMGETIPLPEAELASRYRDRAGYLRANADSLDAAIAAGFLLPEHRDELLAQAAAVTFPPVIAPA